MEPVATILPKSSCDFTDVLDAVKNRLEVREDAPGKADEETRRTSPDAGRLTPGGRNLQHL